MRVIKFRCWSEKHKRYFYDVNDIEKYHETIGYDEALDSDEYYLPYLSFYIPNIESEFTLRGSKYYLEQYTGLKDKNGKEIYEGDIVNIDFNNEGIKKAVVKWKNDLATFYFDTPKENYYLVDMLFRVNHLEIIGNIHDQEVEE